MSQGHIGIRSGSLGIAAAVALSLGGAAGAAAQDRVTFASWGGALQTAQSNAYIEPAQKKLGIRVFQETHGGSFANIKAQVAAGKVTYDLVGMGVAECERGIKEGLLEKLDLSQIPNVKDIDPALVNDYCLPLFAFSTVIAWNTKKYGPTGPKSWAEFFDTTKFPGKRSLRGYPRQTFEVALLADGVEPAKLYPIDVDRAYRKLEQIKPHVVAWWASGAQSAQLLASGEADLVAIWNGRVTGAVQDGAAAAYTYAQGIYEVESLFIPKGAPNKAAAQKLINEFLDPVNQANFSASIDYGPTNPKAFQTGILKEERAKSLPSHADNVKQQVILKADWYATAEGEAAIARWTGFVQK